MSVISIFSGSFCAAEEAAQSVAARLQCPLLRDEDLIGQVIQQGGPSSESLRRAMYGRTSIFNKFSHEKERAMSWLKLGLAELLQKEGMVFLGYASLLLPGHIRHVLSVCIIADNKFRWARAAREMGMSQKEARARVHRDDEAAFRWAESLHLDEPWSPGLYDLLLPMDKTPLPQAVDMITQAAQSPQLQPSNSSRLDAADFVMSAQVERVLAEAGHNPADAQVQAERGKVTIRVDKKVVLMGRLADELTNLVSAVEGVQDVTVEAGPHFYQADVYRRADFQVPSKVLLVDDEREFVQTLSERLLMREIGSAVVHDGEEALRVVAEDEPEVIVLDLKMPGIDGKEVLRRIKRDYPQVEVIILTGHGSQRDGEECLSLGAFAYLEKPVDIEKLSQTMQEAYEAAKRRGK